jgi:hypothetical protein
VSGFREEGTGISGKIRHVSKYKYRLYIIFDLYPFY